MNKKIKLNNQIKKNQKLKELEEIEKVIKNVENGKYPSGYRIFIDSLSLSIKNKDK